MLSIERPISLIFLFSNSAFRRASSVSSVEQTGVKSAGCEKSITQLSFAQSLKVISPCVVTAVKSGAMSPILGIPLTSLTEPVVMGDSLRQSPAAGGSRKGKLRWLGG